MTSERCGYVSKDRHHLRCLLDAGHSEDRPHLLGGGRESWHEEMWTRLAAAERERDEARAMNAAFEVRIENWRELLASSRAEAARMELEMFRARDVAAEHVAAESKERRRAEEAEAETERLRGRMVGCVDCSGTFALVDLDDDGLCSECRVARDAPPPTPEEEDAHHEALRRMFCPEPGCSIIGVHDGPHRTAVGLDDIATIEWSEPGAYLAALRPLAARSALGKEG